MIFVFRSPAQTVSPDVADAERQHRRHSRLPRQQALRRVPLDHTVRGNL